MADFDFVAYLVAHPRLASALVSDSHAGLDPSVAILDHLADFIPFAVVSPPRFVDHVVPVPALGTGVYGDL